MSASGHAPTTQIDSDVATGQPLYILSFRQRDELAAIAARAGWQVIAARRADASEGRFAASGASVAVVDARGALGDGLAAAAGLGEIVRARGGAMLVLVSHGDIAEIATFFDAGATHFLASPHSEAEFVQALRFAARFTERLAGGWRYRSGNGGTLGWRLTLGDRHLRLTSNLAALLDLDEETTPRAALRRIGREEARQTLRAFRRLQRTGATAVAHDVPGIGRIVQHMQYDAANAHADGLVERVIGIPEPSSAVGHALSSVRDASTARRWLDRRLAAPGGAPVQLALIALSRFDIVNTAYGRVAGDSLLGAAHQRIDEITSELLGRDAIVARMAGAEFLLACEDAPARLELAAGRIAEALVRPFVVGGSMVVMGCRIGIAPAEPGDNGATLLRRASEALALAKASDSITVHIARQDEESGTSMDLLAVDLRHALDQGEIGIVFQPQVAIATGNITGVEALARWDHPTLGPLGAETLFAAAERADLAIGLSDHIQRVVLAQAAAWPAVLGHLRLSLNLTAGDIGRPGFADIFLDRVDSSGFPRSRLTVELTEGGLVEDLGIAAGLLAQLRSAGCRVAIDDFGTGYSSLAYLKALPLDYLKIDKKLAQDITGSARDRVVVRGVIDMARSLGLSVIAEGVETPEQLDLLAREGCQYYQGFLCAEPLTTEALVALVSKGRG
jgi:EAL domain-containing protein (putative c-di-GMP-specific phosphodiesterase class I)/GGDEF domain-containing protein